MQTKIKLYAFLCENANVFLQNYNSEKIHNYKTCLKAFFLTFKVQQVQANASFLWIYYDKKNRFKHKKIKKINVRCAWQLSAMLKMYLTSVLLANNSKFMILSDKHETKIKFKILAVRQTCSVLIYIHNNAPMKIIRAK